MTTQTEVRRIVTRMKGSLQSFERDIRWLIEVNGWHILGYESLAAFWDAEFGPLPIAAGLRNWIIVRMHETAPKSSSSRLRNGERELIGAAVGVSPQMVSSVVERHRKRSTPKYAGKSEHEPVVISMMVPKRWHRHILTTASAKNVNMADLLRPLIKEGMKRRHGVDLDEPIQPVKRR